MAASLFFSFFFHDYFNCSVAAIAMCVMNPKPVCAWIVLHIISSRCYLTAAAAAGGAVVACWTAQCCIAQRHYTALSFMEIMII